MRDGRVAELTRSAEAPAGPREPEPGEDTLSWLLRGLEESAAGGGAAYDTRVSDSSPSAPGQDSVPRPSRRGTLVLGLGALALVVAGIVGLGVTVLGGQLSAAPDTERRAAAPASQPADSEPPLEPGAGAAPSSSETAGAETGPDPDTRGARAAESARTTVDPAWLADTAAAAEIPEPALRAYANAALTVGREQPYCGIGWNTLAAIGQVETHHGTIGDAQLLPDGRALPRIVGVALDGVEFAAIPDTDGGSIDGDARWDRAVGPMQFIPQTWAQYGRSASGTGSPNIDRVDDAALSAAAMLCTIGGDLRVAENWIAAVNAYNPSVAYNNDVADAADRYAAFG
ncbi:hypothetical protein GCM10009693_15970 [Leucobacter chromiireducens subsp. chromiireducens]|uniref:Lytic murein transglycosylase n=1 Tax=Leucobacter chromiireducens subsp. chromiireducens TaxID=660067 RepID=A0ABS1SMP7_9MICO|nr:lytic murein transglycosylase [Leucobacter chromiireducens subsp. chromiireducens]